MGAADTRLGSKRCPFIHSLVLISVLGAASAASAQIRIDADTLAQIRASAAAIDLPAADKIVAVEGGIEYGIAPLPPSVPVIPTGGATRGSTLLYDGLLPGSNGFWRYTSAGGLGELAYAALDDGFMGPAGAAAGGGNINRYEFSFGIHSDFAGDVVRPYVIVSFYNAPQNVVGSATNPVVTPPAPVSSIGWIFNSITLPSAGFFNVRSGLINLAAIAADFDLDESFYVEILPMEWSNYPAGVPVIDPDLHAIFTGPGTVSVGVNQNNMWSDYWVRNAGCTIVNGNHDGLYQNPAEKDVCNSPPLLNQSGIRLFGDLCPSAYILQLDINAPADICVRPGDPVTVTLSQSCLPGLVRGYQAFLQFDTSRLTFSSGSYFVPTPYGQPILAPVTAVGPNIDVAAGIDNLAGQVPTSSSGDLVTLNFVAGATDGATQVVFRPHAPPTRFSDPVGNNVTPTTIDSQVICVDGTAPAITCPPDPTPQCIAGVPAPATNYASFVSQGGVAVDNGCFGPVAPTVALMSNINNGGAGCAGNPYIVTRVYRATDCAGNFAECTQTITVIDTTGPTGTPPSGATLECSAPLPPAATTIAAYNALSGASATDNCTATGSLTVAHADGSLVGTTCSGTRTRTYAITDLCGNSTNFNQVFTIQDTTAPIVSPPSGTTLACPTDLPAAVTTIAAFLALSGASASDNCTPTGSLTVSSSTGGLVGTTCSGTITRTYTIGDGCGNNTPVNQVFTVNDNVSPTGTPPNGATVECLVDVPPAVTTIAAYLALPGASASDNCTPTGSLTVSSTTGALVGGPCGGTVTRTYTIRDACLNLVNLVQTFTVDDTIAPAVVAGSDLSGPANAGGCTGTVTWAAASANDNCLGNISGSVVYDIDLGNNGSVDFANQVSTSFTFPTGTHKVTAKATDACGNTGTDDFLVTVTAVNELIVDVEFEWAFTGTRCITFELWNCVPLAGPTVVSQPITFSGGLATGVLVNVPCAAYSCITARDRLHTLRRTDDTLQIIGTQYKGEFTGADRLRGGNLNDDGFIDILDFGIYNSQYLVNYGSANTTCSTTAPHADISGSVGVPGLVFTEDFTFIQINFTQGHEANCCGQAILSGGGWGALPPGFAGDGPVTSISVADLHALGLGDLAAGDLNEDGVLDVLDMYAFMGGARPGGGPPSGEPATAPLEPDGKVLVPRGVSP